jgi:plasmid stabilization system protein ParE
MAGNVYQISITLEAEADKDQIIDWYEAQAQGLGERWLTQFEQALYQLAANPLIYQEEVLFVRKVAVRPFRHNVYFVADTNALTVVILAVLHQHQDPDELLRRLNLI